METNYITKKSFQVLLLAHTHSSPVSPSYELAEPSPSLPLFNNYEEAETWIQEKGVRQVNYVIIEVFRKR